jgi:hypothetical protein
METSLHRQLKQHYADENARTEVSLGDYRIDAISGDWLVEIQHGSLAAIRDKVGRLVENHQVLVVKPLIMTKRLIKRARKNGRIVDRRKSPKRATWLDLFDELLYFTRVFPHPNLAVEGVMVDVEEWRYPGHGRRRRRRESDFIVEDQKLMDVHGSMRLAGADDLWQLLGDLCLPSPFHTGHLAEQLDVQRWVAQRVTYVLRKTCAIRAVGKKGNAVLYLRNGDAAAEVA